MFLALGQLLVTPVLTAMRTSAYIMVRAKPCICIHRLSLPAIVTCKLLFKLVCAEGISLLVFQPRSNPSSSPCPL